MKFSSLAVLSVIVLAAGAAFAQESRASAEQATPSSLADEIKTLRDAIAQQQQQIAQQQQRIGQQQQQIDSLQKALESKPASAPHVEDATLRTEAPAATKTASDDTATQEKPKESPLSFRIGGTEFTPGGFVDFENVFRTTNTGNNISTNFGAIPFSNSVQGNITEFRTTGQYSRFNLKITGKYGANDIMGYLEGDFNGNDPTNVFVTSNSHTARLRLYWLDLKRGNWEFLGGQSWGWATPNRVGLSPMPADLAITIGEDANIHVGINYTRAGTFRAVYHFTDKFQWGVAVENSQQYVSSGTPAPVVFPVAFRDALTPQFDAANNNATPNLAPDLWTKMAWDSAGGRQMHFEVGGVMTTAKITFQPTGIPGVSFHHDSNVGGGIVAATNVAITKNFRFLANAIAGKGIARYMIGLGPDVVVAPVSFNRAACTPTAGCAVSISGVHAGSGLGGFEWQARPKTLFGLYYGAAYFERNAFPDLTSPASSKPFIGFGGINSATTANRAIQQGTIDINQTFWRNPQYGAVLLILQSSYLTRSPWFVAAGAPKNAHLFMQWLSLRYVLP